jgi:hypothetical protein
MECSEELTGVNISGLMAAKWTSADVPDQAGRVAIITGSNTGVGYEAAAALADRGAHVVLAVRKPRQGQRRAKPASRREHPTPSCTVQELDLASLESVRKAAETLRAAHQRIDLLINNAGVMTSRQGGHRGWLRAAVRHRIIWALRVHWSAAGPNARGGRLRVVTMSSPGHRFLSRSTSTTCVGRHVQPVRRLRAVKARQSAVHLRAGPSAGGQGRPDGRISPRTPAHRTPSCCAVFPA